VATELRRIVFSNEEVIEAIKRYNDVARKKLPDGAIVSCSLSDAEGLIMTLEMFDYTIAKRYRIALKASFIGAALMKWCLDHKIPMSRVAEKTLEVVGNNLSIAMTINKRSDDLSEVPEERFYMRETEPAA
jgi:hypothetical protein